MFSLCSLKRCIAERALTTWYRQVAPSVAADAAYPRCKKLVWQSLIEVTYPWRWQSPVIITGGGVGLDSEQYSALRKRKAAEEPAAWM